MPENTTVTGLHTPITNIVPSESTIAERKISHGSIGGLGDELPLHEGSVTENVARTVNESGIENGEVDFLVPDLLGLADIGIASFGEIALRESVIGTDERVRITETDKYPWRVIASLLITAADNTQYIGTGWFISPRTLITAGHCVFIKNNEITTRNGWVKRIQVMPGRNANQLPFGGQTSTEFWSVKGWGDQGLQNYDYGAIILPAPFPQELGHFAFGVFDDAKLQASVANVAGYPGDKPGGTLWYDSRSIGSVNPDKVYYAADTAGGQSGAPAYIVENGERVAVAVHAYGGNTSNSGTRISSQVFTNLESWKRS